jgi:hypothetical protein
LAHDALDCATKERRQSMKRAFASLILAFVLFSTIFYAVPALAVSVSAPSNLTAVLSVKSDRWCALTLHWSQVSNANAGYELIVYKSNNQSLKVSLAKGTTSAQYTLTNDSFVVKLRAVYQSSSGVKIYSSYATKSVAMLKPTLTANKSFLAMRPGAGIQLSVQAIPTSSVAFSVADPTIASVSSTGYVTGRKHGSTSVIIQSGPAKITVGVYVSFATGQIQAVCSEKGYVTNAYWSYSKSAGNPNAYTASPYKATTATATSRNRPGDGDYVGYTFDYSAECMGFAHYLGYRISGFQPKSDWTKYVSVAAIKAEGGLQIGDILRTATHSAILYNIASDGTLYFAEAWGGSNNIIKINGRFAGTSSYVSLDTIPSFAYVYRCKK